LTFFGRACGHQEGKGFFFEKKNQKTFILFGFVLKTDKSLFASFSSEKEDLPSLPPHRRRPPSLFPCCAEAGFMSYNPG
jgi:hypothetical protein